jgi:hypothetical protein
MEGEVVATGPPISGTRISRRARDKLACRAHTTVVSMQSRTDGQRGIKWAERVRVIWAKGKGFWPRKRGELFFFCFILYFIFKFKFSLKFTLQV